MGETPYEAYHPDKAQQRIAALEQELAATKQVLGEQQVQYGRLRQAEILLASHDSEVVAVLESIPGHIHVREGGGPENLYASLAVSVAKLVELKDDHENALKFIDNPPGDEQHCTCVPTLKAELAGLRRDYAVLSSVVVDLDKAFRLAEAELRHTLHTPQRE